MAAALTAAARSAGRPPAAPRGPRGPARPSYRETLRAEASRAAAAPSLVLAQGDRVEHGAFGRGVVRSVQPMGGDALVQVDFEGAGTKKLMLKAAAKHLKKVGG